MKKKPEHDWLQKIEKTQEKLDKVSEKLEERKEMVAEKAKVIGRRQASAAVKKFDKVFTPLNLKADDSKVIFHPIDYIVFNGMKAKQMKNVILLDRVKKTSEEKKIQKSIDKTVAKGNYEWITLRIEDNGDIVQE